ncbi:MAG: acyltransferase [Steroidobacteraceae bacterium]
MTIPRTRTTRLVVGERERALPRLKGTGMASAASRLLPLDGVRALLALWVVFGHLATMVACRIPVLTNPAIAVDLFLFLSGFFIAATFASLRARHGHALATRYFWIRRVMRIWPLYAVLLTIAYLCIGEFDGLKHAITNLYQPELAGGHHRGYAAPSMSDALLHYTMLFGLIDTQATATPLPDWSLSLEFQFYLLFPLLALALRRHLWLVCAVAICLAFITPTFLGFYGHPGELAHFRQPSVLTYKLNLFLVGSLAHHALGSREADANSKWVFFTAMILCLAIANTLTRIGIAVMLFLIFNPESRLAKVLSLRVLAFFGEISYTIYLVHLLVMLPVLGLLIQTEWFLGLSAYPRFVVGSLIVFAVIVPTAWLLYVLVERPGIKLGHWLTTRAPRGATSAVMTQTAEQNAAQ